MSFAPYGAQGPTINAPPPMVAQGEANLHPVRKLTTGTGVVSFWFRPDTIVGTNDGDAVATWTTIGQSGASLAQASGTKKPLLKLAILNALNGIRFDGSNDDMTSSAAQFSSGIASIAIVFKLNAVAASKNIVGAASGFGEFRLDAGSVLEVSCGTARDLSTAPETTAYHIYVISFNGASGATALRDGVSESIVAGTINTGADATWAMGSNGGGSGAFASMDVVEYISEKNVAWTAQNMQDVSDYLNRRYRIY